MTLLELIRRESDGLRWDVFVAAVISGIANAAVLAVINASTQVPKGQNPDRYLVLFVIVILLYIVCFRYTFRRVSHTFEQMLHRIRLRIVSKIETAELSILEKIGKSRIYNVMTNETLVISQSSGSLTFALQASLLVTFSALYIFFLSKPAFVLMVALVAAGLFIYRQYGKEAVRLIHLATQKEIGFIDTVTHAIEGFKEVKLNQRRREDLFRELERISGTLGEFRIQTEDVYNKSSIFSQVAFYVLIGSVVFVLPRIIPHYAEILSELTTSILFVIGPLTALIGAIPAFSRANIASDNIARLETALDELTGGEARKGDPARFAGFETLSLKDIEFAFQDAGGQRGFAIGPLSLTVRSGEILFITGGNGSGKSTLLRVLTGLYAPSRGGIFVDGERIDAENLQSYRELFTAIFSDFHLFDKLYGLRDLDPARVNELLSLMQLQDKTAFAGDRFTTQDLSTGQRKRLALVVALLDDKPIYLFDELAADQDPEFRRFLYETLLKDLTRRGRTVIAVTHDDHYFHVADRIVKMTYGKITEVRSSGGPAAAPDGGVPEGG